MGEGMGKRAGRGRGGTVAERGRVALAERVKQAAAALGIDVPIARVEEEGEALVLYLYGGGVRRAPEGD